MKMREIILDFTSLLDVIMIILFWFILHYKAQANRQINEAKNAAAAAVAQAEAQQEQADALAEQAQQAIAIMEEGNPAQAENNKAIIEFANNNHIKIKLIMGENAEDGWSLEVLQGEITKATINDREPKKIGQKIVQSIDDLKDDPNAVVLCTFTYDSRQPGTNEAYNIVVSALSEITLGYKHFYWSETDFAPSAGE